MSSTRNNTRWLLRGLAAAGLTVALNPGTALAGTIVVRSTGPSAGAYPVGKALPADGKVTLKPGDVVTVLDAKGTRVLKGPGVLAVAGSGATSGSGFSALIANSGARQSRTGATRSAIGGGPARSPNVWYVDAGKGGTHCVADPASLALWRADSSGAGSATVTRLADGKSAGVEFRAGQSVRGWPAELGPVGEGSQYRIALAGAKEPVTVRTTLVMPAGAELDAVAAALMPKGCTSQIDLLIEGTRAEAATTTR